MANKTEPFDLMLLRANAKARNLAHSRWPVSKMTDQEVADTRRCKHCGGLRRLHGIYGTYDHVPDLDKLLGDYQVATAFCEAFEPTT